MTSLPERRPIAHRVWRRMAVAEKVIDRLGLDRLALARLNQGTALAEIMRNCIDCSSIDRCRSWLEVETDADDLPPQTCPNRHLFEACLAVGDPTSETS